MGFICSLGCKDTWLFSFALSFLLLGSTSIKLSWLFSSFSSRSLYSSLYRQRWLWTLHYPPLVIIYGFPLLCWNYGRSVIGLLNNLFPQAHRRNNEWMGQLIILLLNRLAFLDCYHRNRLLTYLLSTWWLLQELLPLFMFVDDDLFPASTCFYLIGLVLAVICNVEDHHSEIMEKQWSFPQTFNAVSSQLRGNRPSSTWRMRVVIIRYEAGKTEGGNNWVADADGRPQRGLREVKWRIRLK